MEESRIRYRVHGLLYKPGKPTTDLITVDRFFEEDEPIIAREKAFTFFQDYIEVLLQSLGKKYISYEQAINDLQPFVSTNEPIKNIIFFGQTADMDPDYNKGLFIQFMSSEGDYFNISFHEEISSDYCEIHCIAKEVEQHYDSLAVSLQYEYRVYEKYNLTCDNENPKMGYILDTPLNYQEALTSWNY
jgi:hypothetical protein